MSDPFEITTPSGLVHVTVQPWTETQRAQAISEIRQVVDSLTAAFLAATGTVCARTDGPLEAGDLAAIERFRDFLTHAPEAGPAAAYERVYELQTITISGGSDDLVEVVGADIREEFDAYQGAFLVVTASSGERLWLTATFDPPELRRANLHRDDGGWVLAVVHTDPAWAYPVRLVHCSDPETDPAIELDVPAGTTVAEWVTGSE